MSYDIIELLRGVELFSSLPEYELDVIAQYSEIISYERGAVIFKQDDLADSIYILAQGKVGIISMMSVDEIVIAQIREGESFGELDFLGQSNRSAGAMTEDNSKLVRFPAKRYRDEDVFFGNSAVSARLLYRLLGIVSERIWNVHKQLCDKTTGLYNQTYLKEDFVNLLPELGSSVALVMIKPDNFKEINDNYGHDAGDQVLHLMAIFLQSELLAVEIGVRFKGDEYAAVIIDAEKETAIERAKSINSALKNIDLSGLIDNSDFKLQFSIGISLYPSKARNSSDLVAGAHKKMYHARNSGGNRISI
jgi:diguanylate cyclase (GGDEF)-like protein